MDVEMEDVGHQAGLLAPGVTGKRKRRREPTAPPAAQKRPRTSDSKTTWAQFRNSVLPGQDWLWQGLFCVFYILCLLTIICRIQPFGRSFSKRVSLKAIEEYWGPQVGLW